jgi:hypothetical protein
MYNKKFGESDLRRKDWNRGVAVELFYIDLVEPGNPRKAPFVLRNDDQSLEP